MKLPYLVAAASTAALIAGPATAAVVGFTNANFDNNADGNIQTVDGWFDINTGNGDLQQAAANANVPTPPSGTFWLNIVDSTSNGVDNTGVYQSFGTKDATDLAYTFDFAVGERADADFNDLTFSLYYGASGLGSNGTAPAAVSGLTFASSTLFDYRVLESGTATTGSASVTLPALTVPVGQTVYLAIASIDNQTEAGSQQALIDDISVTAVVPEPASAMVGGVAGLMLLARRRRA